LPCPEAPNEYPKVSHILKAFITNSAHPVTPENQFMKACPINFDDPLFELVPENYLDDTRT
jgi:hypothetical protein